MKETTERQYKRSAMLCKCGFTLAELSVVLFLVAIIATMTVSFSVLINNYTTGNKAEYEFLSQCSELKEDVTDYIYENDTFSLETLSAQNFTDKYSEIESVVFMQNGNGNIIKCAVTSASGKEQSFAVYLRAATITTEATGGE